VQYLAWLRGICFDVRIGRPRHELRGFDAALADSERDVAVSAGMHVRVTEERTHAGRGALEVVVPEGGGELRVPLGDPARRAAGSQADARARDVEAWLECDAGGRASASTEASAPTASAPPGAAPTARAEIGAATWTPLLVERAGNVLVLRFETPGTWRVDSI